MNKKLLALPLVLILAACGKDEPKQALECNHPAAIQSIKTQIQNIIRQEARAFARNDSRQFVDADKVIAAGSELEIGLNNAQQIDEDNKTMCGADLSIRVPADVLNAAETNSPLIYSETTLAEILEQKLTGSNLKFDDNTLSTSVRYTPDKDGNAVLEDNTVSMTARTLSSLLLPYGVKSIVMIDGKAVSKEDAMKLLKGKHDEPPVVSPEDILENNAASQASGVPQAAGLETEILHPDIEAKSRPSRKTIWTMHAAKTAMQIPKFKEYGTEWNILFKRNCSPNSVPGFRTRSKTVNRLLPRLTALLMPNTSSSNATPA